MNIGAVDSSLLRHRGNHDALWPMRLDRARDTGFGSRCRRTTESEHRSAPNWTVSTPTSTASPATTSPISGISFRSSPAALPQVPAIPGLPTGPLGKLPRTRGRALVPRPTPRRLSESHPSGPGRAQRVPHDPALRRRTPAHGREKFWSGCGPEPGGALAWPCPPVLRPRGARKRRRPASVGPRGDGCQQDPDPIGSVDRPDPGIWALAT